VNLQPAYDRISAAVRKVDEQVLLFFAGVTWGNLGAGFTAAPGGKEYASRSVLAYHYYAPPQTSVSLQFQSETNRARQLGTGAFLTETGEPGNGNDTLFARPGGVGDGADAARQSWAAWEWKSFCRERSPKSADDVSQLAEWGACKTGTSQNWPGDEPNVAFQTGYARTYATAVAGNILSMAFNVSSGEFELQYEVSDTDLKAAVPTEIYLWPSRYPGGANVIVGASKGTVRVEYDGKGSSVRIYPGGSLEVGARVIVIISSKKDPTALPAVSEVCVQNQAGFVMYFEEQNVQTQTWMAHTDSYPVAQKRCISLGSARGVQQGDPFLTRVHAILGNTEFVHRPVAYRNNNLTATFECQGSTLDYHCWMWPLAVKSEQAFLV